MICSRIRRWVLVHLSGERGLCRGVTSGVNVLEGEAIIDICAHAVNIYMQTRGRLCCSHGRGTWPLGPMASGL